MLLRHHGPEKRRSVTDGCRAGSDPGIFSWAVLRLFPEPQFPYLQNTIKCLLQNVVETHVEYKLIDFLSTWDLLIFCFAKDQVWDLSGNTIQGLSWAVLLEPHTPFLLAAPWGSATEQGRG